MYKSVRYIEISKHRLNSGTSMSTSPLTERPSHKSVLVANFFRILSYPITASNLEFGVLILI